MEKLENYGHGFIEKYLFVSFDEWDSFKEEMGFGKEKYPWNVHLDHWIEPDRIPFIVLYIYDGEGWYNIEFVYPDDFPKIYEAI